MSALPRWAHAHGPITASARIRSTPEDFQVEEILGFEADGEGEHLLLKVEKRGANTVWVARELARYAGVSPREVSYAGMKDRNAVAVLHFSLWLGKRSEPDWNAHQHSEFRILTVARHRRKLRIGSLKGNHFRIALRDLSVPASELELRLVSIRERGVPNYFGPQRFGRNGANIAQAEALFSGQLSLRDRKLRGLLLSTARSLLFNAVLSRRVEEQTWDKLLAGEICMLEGSHSVFHAESVDAELEARAQTGDLHPTGALWGRGASRVTGEAAALESAVLRDYAVFARGLENAGLEQARRALRLPLKELSWSMDDHQSLMLEFFLPAGTYMPRLCCGSWWIPKTCQGNIAMLTRIEHDINIVELRLAHPPANALNPALVHELHVAITNAPDKGARALILSGAEGMFSAGLDVPALLKLDKAAISAFWKEFISLLRVIALSPVPMAAAITGHSPAGGAVLAIFCDTRIAAEGKFKIGLNEVRVGLPVPSVIYAALMRLVGVRQAERLCLHGLLISPDEALRIGLVDQVLPPQQVLPAALEWCRSLLALPPKAVATTRKQARSDLVEIFAKLGDRSHDDLMGMWFSAETQNAMRALVAELAARKK